MRIEEKFRITDIHRYVFDRVFDATFTFGGEAHDFWEIVYVVDGKIEIVENENIYVMGAGDIVFHAPMEFHKFCAIESTAPHVLNLSFSATGALPPDLTNGVFTLTAEQQSTYTKLFQFMKITFGDSSLPDPYTAQEAAYRLSLFIMHLCHTTKAQDAFSATASAATYRALVSLMRSEVCSNLSICDFAEKSFISTSYIKYLFRHYAGISPKSYYNNLRILEAKQLLNQGCSVADTASKMNFSSPNNFIRFFKTHTAFTPYQYKKTDE